MLTGGGEGCAGIGTGSLEALITVAVGLFLATERLDVGRVEALDPQFEQEKFNVLIGDELSEIVQREHQNGAAEATCRTSLNHYWRATALHSR